MLRYFCKRFARTVCQCQSSNRKLTLLADINGSLNCIIYCKGLARQRTFRIPQVISVGDLPDDTPALLHFRDHPQADPPPGIDGALKDEKVPRVMVFDHAVGKTLFGAERSLLDVMARMVARGDVPVMVLPVIRNTDYLERLSAPRPTFRVRKVSS